MAEPVKLTTKKPTNKQRRKRAPVVSALAALVIIAACAIYVGVEYNWGGGQETDAGSPEPEQETNRQPVETDVSGGGGAYIETPVETEDPPLPKSPPQKVRGIYIDVWTIASEGGIDRFIEICDTSEINAIVIDVKDDFGQITFISENELLSPVSNGAIQNITQLVSRLKEHGIYTIARLVCFKDPLWCNLYPALAIHDAHGSTWADDNDVKWLDPYNTNAWDYIAVVAKDAAQAGFDEIQLDYVRFPAEGRLDDIDFGNAGAEKTKATAIGEFLDYMRTALAGTSAWLSADVFGIIAVASGDFEGIGQDLEIIMQNADYVCPMIYPSHFANKSQNGVGQIINDDLFEAPDMHPYEVVLNILQMVKRRMSGDGNNAVIRPYLQAFTADYLANGYYQTYTAQQVLEQIQAVYDAGFDEWILWNHSGDYNVYKSVSEMIQRQPPS